MKVIDYWKCAGKHLNFCKEILDSSISKFDDDNQKFDALVEVYYLLGYVFEGFTIYMAYSLDYKDINGCIIRWDRNKDVEKFDARFCEASHLAFTGAKGVEYLVTNHKFNRIVKGIIRSRFKGMAFETEQMPYFHSTEKECIEEEQAYLIDHWETALRYANHDDPNWNGELRCKITEENLRGLMQVCDTINRLIPQYIGHLSTVR